MPTQVYAVVHDGNGNFLMATKMQRGYFFHNPAGGGTIIPAGQPLNAGGRPAFPGGGLVGQDPAAGARTEFLEETAMALGAATPQNPAPYHGGQGTNWDYYGVYFQLTPADLVTLSNFVQDHLAIGNRAAEAIIEEHFGPSEYPSLMADFPGCPADNELATAYLWNLQTNWVTIETWQNDPQLSWYYNILLNLRNNG